MREIDKLNEVEEKLSRFYDGILDASFEEVGGIRRTRNLLQEIYPEAEIYVDDPYFKDGVFCVPVRIYEPVKEVSITFKINT